ncbi:MAG: ABC transporter ATP-binding protein/permease [Lachnospiraceae bacterium]|nr:ABC transporter ATP-binding protein/permease [Lachnospiraceae bacterium]
MIKTLGSHIKEYKKPALMTPVFMVLEALFETITPLLMSMLVDNGVNKGDMSYIFRMGGVMVICALLGLLSGLMGGLTAATASTGFAKNLRRAMNDNIQRFSFSNIDKFSTAGLVTRLTTDVTNVQNSFQMILRMCIRAPFSLIFAMAAAFIVSARVASVYLVAIIILACFLALIVSRAMGSFRRVFEKYDALNSTIQENVGAIRVVKSFVREDYEISRMEKAVDNIYRLFVKAESIVVLNGPVMQLAVNSCILIIAWIGARMIVAGSLTTGDLMALLTYCMNILMNLMMVSMIFVMISMSVASGERICEVLNEEPDIKNPNSPIMEVRDGSIRFEDVDFSYSKDGSGKPVLKDLDFEIKTGETIGMIGPTGSGKSSLISLISRLYDTTQGTVYVGGEDVRRYDLEVLRKNVSVVLQNNVLFSGSVIDNLKWGDPDASREECIEACRLACADEFIENMPDKYDTKIERGGNNVSGGQKQRLCIARALLKKPKILILDDSTSAVDTATDAKIRQAFLEKIPDVTKIIIAQRISSVEKADRIIVLDEGRISGFDTHENLLKDNEIYREVYESQTGNDADFDQAGGES